MVPVYPPVSSNFGRDSQLNAYCVVYIAKRVNAFTSEYTHLFCATTQSKLAAQSIAILNGYVPIRVELHAANIDESIV